MKNFTCLFLSLALLGAGQAQTAPPPIPAAPVQPAESQSAASAPAAPVALLLRAVPGTALEYAVTSQAQITNLQLNFVGKPGVNLSAAESGKLAEMNKTFGAQLPALSQLLGKNVTTSSKQFLRVLPNDPQGNAVLLSTLVTAPVSGGLDSAGQPLPSAQTQVVKAQVIKLTQTVAPNGQTLSIKAEADDPAVQRLYDSMKVEDLLSTLSQTAQTNLYGLRLAPGQSRSVTQTTDLGPLLGGLGEALGGAGARTQMKAQPLTLNVSTTFLGQSAAGLLNYQQHYSAETWTLSAALGTVGGQTTTLNMKVMNWSGQGGLSYRADGLPQTSDTTQNVSVSMSADLPDMPVQMQVSMNLTLSVSSAVR